MKKYILLSLLIIAISIQANAQFTLGLKGGLNYSKIAAENNQISEKGILGYQFGAWARIGKGFYLQPEVYLGSKGGKFDFQQTSTSAAGSGNVRFTSLDVPLLLGQSFGAKKLNIRIMAGPMYSYILDQSKSISANIDAGYHDFGNYKSSTIGFQAGAGVDIGNIAVDLRYEGGLTKINSNFGQRQDLVHLSLGYRLF
ncbi:MAG: porin family protein [Sphingobacteriaceae bacterium]